MLYRVVLLWDAVQFSADERIVESKPDGSIYALATIGEDGLRYMREARARFEAEVGELPDGLPFVQASRLGVRLTPLTEDEREQLTPEQRHELEHFGSTAAIAKVAA